MGAETSISWCSHTFNPWWGCTKVDALCTNCYAAALDERYSNGENWGAKAHRRLFGDKHWHEPVKWNAAAARDGVRRRVFCASMADVLEDREDLAAPRWRLMGLIASTPHLDWLLLTKRPENLYRVMPSAFTEGPLRNVWLGVSAATVDSVADRVVRLRAIGQRTPFAKLFVSCEPLVELVPGGVWDAALGGPGRKVDWIICGDESAPAKKRRVAEVEWVRVVRDAAERHGAAFHFKQWCGPRGGGIEAQAGSPARGKVHLPMLDGLQHAGFPR